MERGQISSPGQAQLEDCNHSLGVTVWVRKPIEKVFDYLADGRHDPAWQSWVSTSELVRYGGGVGALYRQALHDTSLGSAAFDYRVVHYHRPVLLGVEALSLGGHPLADYRLHQLAPAITAITLLVDLPGSGGGERGVAGGRRWHDRLVSSMPRLKTRLDQLRS